jgi:hypothetical protein
MTDSFLNSMEKFLKGQAFPYVASNSNIADEQAGEEGDSGHIKMRGAVELFPLPGAFRHPDRNQSSSLIKKNTKLEMLAVEMEQPELELKEIGLAETAVECNAEQRENKLELAGPEQMAEIVEIKADQELTIHKTDLSHTEHDIPQPHNFHVEVEHPVHAGHSAHPHSSHSYSLSHTIHSPAHEPAPTHSIHEAHPPHPTHGRESWGEYLELFPGFFPHLHLRHGVHVDLIEDNVPQCQHHYSPTPAPHLTPLSTWPTKK